MLQTKSRQGAEASQIASSREAFEALAGLVRRHLPMLIATIAIIGSLGIVYLVLKPSQFTAAAVLVLDTRKVQVLQQQVVGDTPMDAGTVQTQIEILKSENISLDVIKKLKLTEDVEFVGSGSGLLSTIMRTVGLSAEPSEYRRLRNALDVFERKRTITRVGLTYVMEIRFKSTDPEKAARIANAIAEAYIVDQLEAKYQATRNASSWLQERIQTLRAQVTATERAVVEFKTKNNIVTSNGRLMNDQQLTEVNTQLVAAQAATAEARARLERIDEVIRNPLAEGLVADAQRNEVIIRLRQRYAELQSRESLLSQQYGAQHQATITLRNQLQEIRRSIADELQKIAQSYRSEYEIALARTESLRTTLDSLVSESQSTNQAQIQLRELESAAQTNRTIYDNFLQRYMEAVQQQSFPISEARLISPAAPPLKRSEPSTIIVGLVSIILSLIIGLGIAFLLEFTDRGVRTSAQAEDLLQTTSLGILPKLNLASTALGAAPPPATGNRISTQNLINSYVVVSPLSPFTETLRSTKVSLDLAKADSPVRTIGFTSTLPGEGKSTASSNFAELIAHSGSKCVLVDCDLRSPSLSATLAAPGAKGLVDVAMGAARLDEVLLFDDRTGMAFLPAGTVKYVPHTAEFIGSEAVARVIQLLKAQYKYLVLDLPPIAPVVDARIAAKMVDGLIYVVEWGTTKTDVIEHALNSAPEVHDSLLGVLLNKADMRKLGRYERGSGDYYLKKYYTRYGYLTRDHT